MELQKLLQVIAKLNAEIKSDEARQNLSDVIKESGVIEQVVKLTLAGKDTREVMARFFETLETEYLDDYELIGNMAEAVALSKIDALNKAK